MAVFFAFQLLNTHANIKVETRNTHKTRNGTKKKKKNPMRRGAWVSVFRIAGYKIMGKLSVVESYSKMVL